MSVIPMYTQYNWQLQCILINPLPTNDAYMRHMSSHKPISIYMGGLILGVNILYSLFKLFPMVGKGLMWTSMYMYECSHSIPSVGRAGGDAPYAPPRQKTAMNMV